MTSSRRFNACASPGLPPAPLAPPQALGRVLGLPEAILGGTVMCWAASSGDLAAAVAISRSGMPTMAVAASVAGPVFTLLFGTGVSLLYENSQRGAVEMDVGTAFDLLLLFAGLMLLYFLFGVPLLHKHRLGKRFAYGVLASYSMFVVAYAALGIRL